MDFYNTILVISTVDCGESDLGLRPENIGWRNEVNFYNTLLVILMVNCGELLQITLSNLDGRLW